MTFSTKLTKTVKRPLRRNSVLRDPTECREEIRIPAIALYVKDLQSAELFKMKWH
jgi:hypothetical protein